MSSRIRAIPQRDLDTKLKKHHVPNIEISPERLVAMFEYRYIKRGLLN